MNYNPYDNGFDRNGRQQSLASTVYRWCISRTHDPDAERLQNERLQRQRDMENIQAEFEREKQGRLYEKMAYQITEEARERKKIDGLLQQLKDLDIDRERKCAEENNLYKQRIEHLNRVAAAESSSQSQIYAEELDKFQKSVELHIRNETRETENAINKMRIETIQLEAESYQKQKKTENEIRKTERLAEEKKQQHEKEILQLQEQTRIETEKSRLMWETSKRQMDEQMRIFEKMMIQTIWSIKLDNHFTSRLNFLRTSHREVTRRCTIFVEVLSLMQRNNKSNEKIIMNIMQSKKDLLTNSIHTLRKLMKNEYLNIEDIIFQKQWWALNRVKYSVENVAYSCKRFDELLLKMNEFELEHFIVEIRKAHEDICKTCRLIPTFEDLKNKYAHQTNQSSSSQMSIEDEPSQFKIEEIQ